MTTPKTTPQTKTVAKSSAHYQREFRKRLRAQGLVKKESWINPDNSKLLALVEKELRQHLVLPTLGNASQLIGTAMLSHNPPSWNITELFEALLTTNLANTHEATFALLADDNTIEIVMHQLGDLPLLLTIAGQQMLVEAVLWAVDDVADVASFDAAVLRTHKYFPLSTMGIETFSNGRDYYTVFGALSNNSLLAHIVLEIETLGANVIQAANAYSPYLKNDLTESAL
ncbi:MAG: YjfI family protein [Marinagarivorans sp.]|nr:YjfI family protein [Marinagarivorans sp.]